MSEWSAPEADETGKTPAEMTEQEKDIVSSGVNTEPIAVQALRPEKEGAFDPEVPAEDEQDDDDKTGVIEVGPDAMNGVNTEPTAVVLAADVDDPDHVAVAFKLDPADALTGRVFDQDGDGETSHKEAKSGVEDNGNPDDDTYEDDEDDKSIELGIPAIPGAGFEPHTESR
jgi:hypothetical protein